MLLSLSQTISSVAIFLRSFSSAAYSTPHKTAMAGNIRHLLLTLALSTRYSIAGDILPRQTALANATETLISSDQNGPTIIPDVPRNETSIAWTVHTERSRTVLDLPSPPTAISTPAKAHVENEGSILQVPGSPTASPGGPFLTRDGSTFPTLPSGSGILIIAEGTTSTASVGQQIDTNGPPTGDISPWTPALLTNAPQQTITIGGSAYTAHAVESSMVIIDGHTVRPDATTVIDGESVFLSGTSLVVATGTSTSTPGPGDESGSGVDVTQEGDASRSSPVAEQTGSAAESTYTSPSGSLIFGLFLSIIGLTVMS